MKYVHGEYEIVLSGNVMLIQAFGPWNTECVVAYSQAYRQERAPLGNQLWADIVVLRGESLLIPDAERVLSERVQAVKAMGYRHIAIVTGESMVGVTSRMQLDNLYGPLGMDYEFFTSYGEAKAWLEQKGFITEAESEARFRADLPIALSASA